jgi:hypothetical protein
MKKKMGAMKKNKMIISPRKKKKKMIISLRKRKKTMKR